MHIYIYIYVKNIDNISIYHLTHICHIYTNILSYTPIISPCHRWGDPSTLLAAMFFSAEAADGTSCWTLEPTP
jgi:hypothetical protein